MKLIDKLGLRDFIKNFEEEVISKEKKDILFSIVQSLSGVAAENEVPDVEDE